MFTRVIKRSLSNMVATTKTKTNGMRKELSHSLLNQINSLVGEGNMSQNKQILHQHGKDEGHFESIPADLVVWPQTKEQVSKIISICDQEQISIVPFGAASGLEGGVNAINGGICLDMSRMNQVIEVNQEDFDCRVQAGVTWRDLNAYLRDTGLWFSVDPGASATLGGMAATGASGTNAVKYGTMKQNVLNLEVVTSNGSIINTAGNGTRARKSSAGYNLTELFVGSEGTLGIITELTLRLKAVSQEVSVAVCPFPNTSSAISAAIEILQSGIDVARIEFLDELSMKACKSYSGIPYECVPTLFFEFHSNSVDGMNDLVTRAHDIVNSHGAVTFQSANDPVKRASLWKARHEVYYACKAMIPNSQALSTDVCVPISRLTDMIVGAKKLLDKYKLIGPILGHVGDGNFHSLIIFKDYEKDRVQNVAVDISMLALSLGGTCTGEHGIGRGKMDLLERQFGSESIQVMKALKSTLDPKNILNPGKLFH